MMDDLAFWSIVLAMLCNVTCALLGCYLVLRRLSLIGDAISHGVLPGLALAFLVTGELSGPHIVLGAMLLGFLTAYLTQALHSSGRVTQDASMGIVFTALFALGVWLVTRAGNVHLDVECVLNGKLLHAAQRTTSVLGVEVPRAFFGMAAAFTLTMLFIAFLWKELKIASFDPALATSMGISAAVVHYLLMSLVGGVTVAAFEAVGSILVIAMLIVPAACAHLLTDRLEAMLAWSAIIAALSSALGYLGAELLNTTPSGMMAVVAGGFLLLSVLFAPRHGILAKKWRNWQLRLRIAGEDVLGLLYRREEQGKPFASTKDARAVADGWTGAAALRKLRRDGLIRAESAGIRLSEAGRQHAESLVRAHRLWETYLDENVALPRDHLHDAAHRMEHFIDPDLQRAIAAEVQQADTDPHGRAIPRQENEPVK